MNRPAAPAASGTAAFGMGDVVFAVTALCVLAEPLWQLVLGQGAGSQSGAAITVARAAIASLGFIAIAAQWERFVGLMVRSPLIPAVLILAPASALWAPTPAMALQQGLMLLLVAVLGIGLSLRMRGLELGVTFSAAGLILLLAPMLAGRGMALADPVTTGLLVAGAVLLLLSASGPLAWLGLGVLAAGCLAALGGNVTSAIAALCGGGIVLAVHALLSSGSRSPLTFAAGGLALVAGLSVIVLTGLPAGFGEVVRLFESLGNQAALGTGFGVGGASIATGLAAGLGVWGTGLAVLALIWSLGVGLLGAGGLIRRGLAGVLQSGGAISAAGVATALIIAQPGLVPATGALMAVFFACWAQAVSPNLTGQGIGPRLLIGRRADDVVLPEAHTLRTGQGIQRRAVPSVTRIKVAAAMAGITGKKRRG